MVKVNKEIIKCEFGVDTTAAVGTHNIGVLPAGATITKAWIDVDVTFTSPTTDTATIALGTTNSASLFETAVAIATGTPWDAAAPRVADVGIGVVGSFSVNASDANIICAIAVEDITAGKGYLFVEYVVNA